MKSMFVLYACTLKSDNLRIEFVPVSVTRIAGHVCCVCIDVMHGSIGWLLGMERRSALSLLAAISYLELLNEDHTTSSAYANVRLLHKLHGFPRVSHAFLSFLMVIGITPSPWITHTAQGCAHTT